MFEFGQRTPETGMIEIDRGDWGTIRIWDLTEMPANEVEPTGRLSSRAFEELDRVEIEAPAAVVRAGMEYLCGRTPEMGASFSQCLAQLEKCCTVLDRPLEAGRIGGCILHDGCAIVLTDQQTARQLGGLAPLPVPVGGIAALPVLAVSGGTVELLVQTPVSVEEVQLESCGCRLMEVYKS